MSRRSERKARAEEKRKKLKRDGIFVMLFAVLFLALGIVGIVRSRSAYRGYAESEDIRNVEANVTYAAVHSRKGEYGRKEEYWTADLQYEIDGVTYTGKKEFSSAVQKGDVRTVEVYLSPKGDYRIPAYTSGGAYGVMNIVYIGSAVVGLLLGIMTAVVCFLSDSPQKKNGKQNKP